MKTLKRTLAAGLSALLFFTNSVFCHAFETNLWKERSHYAKASWDESTPRSFSEGGQLASLPLSQNFTPSIQTEPSHQLSGQMRQLRQQTGAGFEQIDPVIRKIFSAVPPTMGSLHLETVGPLSDKSQLLIHVQDVHLNPEAQSRISEFLKTVIQTAPVNFIGTEGAFNKIPLYGLRDLRFRKEVTSAADALLAEKFIAGAYHALLTQTGKSTNAFGIDDESAYQANVEAYRRSLPIKASTEKTLQESLREIQDSKPQIYGSTLQAFDQKVQQYRAEEISLYDYASEISAHAGSLSSNAQTFLKAGRLESSLNLKQVETERKTILEKLTERMTASEMSKLTDLSLAYRLNKIDHVAFYSALEKFCALKNISLDQASHFRDYLQYVFLSDAIDLSRLDSEINESEASIYSQLAHTQEEKSLAARDLFTHLGLRLTQFACTPREWSLYQTLKKKINSSPDLSTFETFYLEAEKRDHAMSASTWKLLQTQPRSIGLVITGGFHAKGMSKYLQKKGVTILSFVPRLTKIEKGAESSYLSVFAQTKSPLQSFLEGEKLFLSPRIGTPDQALTVAAKAAHLTANPADTLKTLAPALTEMNQVADTSTGITLESPTGDRIEFPRRGLPRIIRKPLLGWALFAGLIQNIQAETPGHTILNQAIGSQNILLLGIAAVIFFVIIYAKTRGSRKNNNSIQPDPISKDGVLLNRTIRFQPDKPGELLSGLNQLFKEIPSRLNVNRIQNQSQIVDGFLPSAVTPLLAELNVTDLNVTLLKTQYGLEIHLDIQQSNSENKFKSFSSQTSLLGGKFELKRGTSHNSRLIFSFPFELNETQFELPENMDGPAFAALLSKLRSDGEPLYTQWIARIQRDLGQPGTLSPKVLIKILWLKSTPEEQALRLSAIRQLEDWLLKRQGYLDISDLRTLMDDGSDTIPLKWRRWALWQLIRNPSEEVKAYLHDRFGDDIIHFSKFPDTGASLQDSKDGTYTSIVEQDINGGWTISLFKKTWAGHQKTSEIQFIFKMNGLDALDSLENTDSNENKDLSEWIKSFHLTIVMAKHAEDSKLLYKFFRKFERISPLYTKIVLDLPEDRPFLNEFRAHVDQETSFQIVKEDHRAKTPYIVLEKLGVNNVLHDSESNVAVKSPAADRAFAGLLKALLLDAGSWIEESIHKLHFAVFGVAVDNEFSPKTGINAQTKVLVSTPNWIIALNLLMGFGFWTLIIIISSATNPWTAIFQTYPKTIAWILWGGVFYLKIVAITHFLLHIFQSAYQIIQPPIGGPSQDLALLVYFLRNGTFPQKLQPVYSAASGLTVPKPLALLRKIFDFFFRPETPINYFRIGLQILDGTINNEQINMALQRIRNNLGKLSPSTLDSLIKEHRLSADRKELIYLLAFGKFFVNARILNQEDQIKTIEAILAAEDNSGIDPVVLYWKIKNVEPALRVVAVHSAANGLFATSADLTNPQSNQSESNVFNRSLRRLLVRIWPGGGGAGGGFLAAGAPSSTDSSSVSGQLNFDNSNPNLNLNTSDESKTGFMGTPNQGGASFGASLTWFVGQLREAKINFVSPATSLQKLGQRNQTQQSSITSFVKAPNQFQPIPSSLMAISIGLLLMLGFSAFQSHALFTPVGLVLNQSFVISTLALITILLYSIYHGMGAGTYSSPLDRPSQFNGLSLLSFAKNLFRFSKIESPGQATPQRNNLNQFDFSISLPASSQRAISPRTIEDFISRVAQKYSQAPLQNRLASFQFGNNSTSLSPAESAVARSLYLTKESIRSGVRAFETPLDSLNGIINNDGKAGYTSDQFTLLMQIHRMIRQRSLASQSNSNRNNASLFGTDAQKPETGTQPLDLIQIQKVALHLRDAIYIRLGGKTAAQLRSEAQRKIIYELLSSKIRFEAFLKGIKDISTNKKLNKKKEGDRQAASVKSEKDQLEVEIRRFLETSARDWNEAHPTIESNSPGINQGVSSDESSTGENQPLTNRISNEILNSGKQLSQSLKIKAGVNIPALELIALARQSLSKNALEFDSRSISSGLSDSTSWTAFFSTKLSAPAVIGILSLLGFSILELTGFSSAALSTLYVGLAAELGSLIVSMMSSSANDPQRSAEHTAPHKSETPASKTPESGEENSSLRDLAHDIVGNARLWAAGSYGSLDTLLESPSKFGVMDPKGTLHTLPGISETDTALLLTYIDEEVKRHMRKGDFDENQARMVIQWLARNGLASENIGSILGDKNLLYPIKNLDHLNQSLPAILKSLSPKTNIFLIVEESQKFFVERNITSRGLKNRVRIILTKNGTLIQQVEKHDWLNMATVEEALSVLWQNGEDIRNIFVALPEGLGIKTQNLGSLSLLNQVKFVLMRELVQGIVIDRFDLEKLEKIAKLLAFQA